MQPPPIRFRLDDGPTADRTLQEVARRWPRRIDRGCRRATTYYDTFDWRLHTLGAVLWSEDRARSTILHLAPDDGTAPERLRIEKAPGFVWDLPPGGLRDRLEPIVEVRRLLPMVTIQASGDVLNVVDSRKKSVATLRFEASEATTFSSGLSAVDLPYSLTLLPVRGYSEFFYEVLQFLEVHLGLKPCSESELVEAAQALGMTASGYSKKLDLTLDPDAPAFEAMLMIHRRLLEIMQNNEEGLRLDLDSEFLHEFRVAVRRTRSALTQIKGVFPDRVTERFRSEFSWLGQITGPSRDLHVYQLKFPGYRASLPEAVRPDLDPLRIFLDRHQRIEHQDLVGLLDSDRYQHLVADWRAFLDAPSFEEEIESTASIPILELASKRIWRSYKRVVKRGSAVGPETPAAALHRLRIECKKLRYLLEFFRSLFPEPTITVLIEELKRLQDNLGDFNDFEVQQISLRKFGQTMVAEHLAPVATILAMGRLIERLEEGQNRERERFHRRFEKFSSRKNRRRFRRLFRPRREPEA